MMQRGLHTKCSKENDKEYGSKQNTGYKRNMSYRMCNGNFYKSKIYASYTRMMVLKIK